MPYYDPNEPSALQEWLAKAKLEQEQQDATESRELERIDYDAKSQLNDLAGRANRGEFNAPNWMDVQDTYLPAGAKLNAANRFQQAALKGEETRIRQEALDRTEQNKLAKFQGDTARRSALHRVASFNMMDFDQANDEAPELEGLRSDIQLDPATLSYKQVAKKGINERAVRDQEIADFYGVPVEIVGERRTANAIAKQQAADREGDREWQEMQRGWAVEDRKYGDEQKARVRAGQAFEDATRESNMAQELLSNPVLAQQYLADPNTDSRLQKAARSALMLHDLKQQAVFINRQSDMRAAMYAKIMEDARRESRNPSNTELYEKDVETPEFQREAWTRAEYLTRLPFKMWKQEQQKADPMTRLQQQYGVGLGATMSALNNAPSIQPTGTPQWDNGPADYVTRRDQAPTDYVTQREPALAAKAKPAPEQPAMSKKESRATERDPNFVGPPQGNDNQRLLQWLSGVGHDIAQRSGESNKQDFFANAMAQVRKSVKDTEKSVSKNSSRGEAQASTKEEPKKESPRERQYATKEPFRMEQGEDPVSILDTLKERANGKARRDLKKGAYERRTKERRGETGLHAMLYNLLRGE